MRRFLRKPRIACIDLTFNWPPVGGCWIDTYHVLKGLQDRGAEVCLFTPDFQTYYPRGDIREATPFRTLSIPFNRFTYNFYSVRKRFRHAVNTYGADMVFLTDGYHMKNHLLTAIGPERCFLRFYAYELLCVNLHYYRYHEDRICDQGFFQNPVECHRCWFQRMPAWGRALQIAVDWPETHPKLHFSQEYLASLAFTEGYHRRLLANLKQLRGAIVYNSFMQQQLEPYVENIHVIPSGVDSERFVPAEEEESNEQPVKIFLPGRANDPHKGLPVAIKACEFLAKQGLSFELHYTAAMDCEHQAPWLINRGWVNQDQLPEMYREMDIVIVPSIWIEPFGITALEGMASAKPVVASRIGGLAHTVVDQVTGLHVEAEDVSGLARALETLIHDPEMRKQMGKAGRERAVNHYDWNVIVDRHYVPMVEEKLREVSDSKSE